MFFGTWNASEIMPQLATGMLFGSVLLVMFSVLIVKVFYLMTLSRALKNCSPQARKSYPGMIWLELIPVIGVVWSFVNVIQVSGSIGNEFRRRNIASEDSPSIMLGIIACILGVGTAVFPFAGVAGVICWIIYWMKISDYCHILRTGVHYNNPQQPNCC